jgi:hypothetical protein
MLAFAAWVLAVDDYEPSKAPFYICSGALVLWAVGLAFMGLRQPAFPASSFAARVIYGASTLLVADVIAAAVLSS